MKVFIIRILAFSAVFISILLLIIMIASFSHVFLPSDMYYCDDFNRAFTEKDFGLIAIGNSKLLSSLDNAVLSRELDTKSANLGFSSANISVSYLTLKAYLNKCIVKPKVVLLEVSWFTFNGNRTTLHWITGDLLLKDFALWDELMRYYPKIANNLKIAIAKQLMSKFNKVHNINYSARFIEKTPYIKEYEFSTDEFELVFPNYEAGIDNQLLNDFYSIVRLCQENNIHLILYNAPEDETFTLCQKDRKLIIPIFEQTSKKYNNVEYLDYTLGGEFWDKKFELWLSNSHHINENDLFTCQLAADIKEKSRLTKKN
jgi:hypothetical protein